MTKRIRQLDSQTIAAIAAGEVVENPASVVKELCENALDAGADIIRVEIAGGGIRRIVISDNGHGMNQDDALHAFDQHATSKILTIEDLETVGTMGFRGEALASIASVSKVTLDTREPGENMGTRVVIHGGELLEHVPTGCREGTTIRIDELFYNVPARYKFLKTDQTEGTRVASLLRHLALARPDVSFHLTSDRKEILHSPGNDDLLSTIHALYGADLAEGMTAVLTDTSGTVKVSGYISRPNAVRKSRNWQMFFVNKRLVQDRTILRALEDAYQTLMMKGRFPAAVLFLEIPAHLVDVNVHPQKTQLRYWRGDEVYRAVYDQVKNTVYSAAADHVRAAEAEQTASTEAPQRGPSEQVQAEPSATALPLDEPATPVYQQQSLTLPQVPAEPVEEDVPILVGRRDLPEEVEDDPVVAEPEHSPRMQKLLQARPIGHVFNTYLLFEAEDELLLVDQHAAHERILFEQKLQAWQERQRVPAQLLLKAEVLRLAPDEMELLEGAEELLKQIGFDWSVFGKQEVLLRAVPEGTNPSLAASDLRDTLHTYRDQEESIRAGTDEGIIDLLAMASCKAAVKAHDPLKPQEVEALVQQMAELENPWHCPHGRPVLVEMSRKELERLFQRIVN